MRAMFSLAVLVASLGAVPVTAAPAAAPQFQESGDPLPPGCFILPTGNIFCVDIPIEGG